MTRRGRLIQGFAAAAGLALVAGGLHVPTAPASGAAPAGTLAGTLARVPDGVVRWDAERQHIDGFGGSFAFHKAGSIQRLGEPLTSQILDMIFSREEGIGLDIVRVMVGDGGTWGDRLYDGPTDTIMPAPGELVWDQPDWEQRKADFDAHQVWLMRQAQARGVETILATVWSAPAWMKQNGSVLGGGPDNRVRPEMYQQFADYLAEYVLGYSEHFGIDITHISPANEPDIGASYSSSRWTPEELSTFVRDHLGPTFEARGVPAEIVLGEAVRFSDAYVRPALADPVAADHVDVVAAHAYAGLLDGATTPDVPEWATARGAGATIWQTEYMNQGAPRDRLFVNNTITDGLRYATLIANMFDLVDLNGYFWWWPASNSGADGSNLIRLQNTGTPQSGNPTETGQYRVFKRYYAIGNYSRFIEPGWVMIDADRSPAPDVIVTAYKDPASGNFAVVVVNRSAGTRNVTLHLDGFPARTGAVVPYRTSASENLRRLAALPAGGGTVTVELRGSSVTTLVPAAFAPPALPDRKDVFSSYLAEENDGQSPGLRVRTTPDGDRVLAGLRHGSYVRYDNVNFADGSAAGFLDQMGELRMHARVAAGGGGAIEVRLDDPRTGPVVGVMDVPPAADPDAWVTVTADIDTDPTGGAYGFHDMYLVFAGDCTTVVTGHRTGPLTVSTGVTCLDGATLTGPVRVSAGAALVAHGATITGPVTAGGPARMVLCGTRVTGPVTVAGAGAVTVGDPDGDCDPNTITGPVRITGTAGPTVLAGNRVVGPLACAGNDPAPVDNGHPNTVTGPRTGQCTDLDGPHVSRPGLFRVDRFDFSD